MIEFCFMQIEYYLKQIKNTLDEYVFQKPRRLVREKPDYDFIKASVSENNPYCLIVSANYKETPFGGLFNTYSEYCITTIVHQGSGTADYELTGSHEGNNSYVLKITLGGIIGTPPHPKYILTKNGIVGPESEIPVDGKIPIGDATIFEFEVGGVVVLNDTYTWQTIAKRVNVSKEKEIDFGLHITIWAKTKKEIFESDGYLDQLSKFLIERYVTDGVQVIRQSPGVSRWIQGEFEIENNLVCGALDVLYSGAIYSQKEDALVCKVLWN